MNNKKKVSSSPLSSSRHRFVWLCRVIWCGFGIGPVPVLAAPGPWSRTVCECVWGWEHRLEESLHLTLSSHRLATKKMLFTFTTKKKIDSTHTPQRRKLSAPPVPLNNTNSHPPPPPSSSAASYFLRLSLVRCRYGIFSKMYSSERNAESLENDTVW